MRHGKTFNHLGRTAPHRKAMLANMASSLILHKRINTTLAKAKALRRYVEPLITKSKDDSTHSRRTVFAYLKDKQAVSILFREVSGKIAERPGGYTRIIKTGFRQGDNAETAMIELVDFNENLLKPTKTGDKKAKTTRRGRSGAGATKKAEVAAAPAPVVEAKVEETPVAVVETPVVEAVVEQAPVAEVAVEETPVVEASVAEVTIEEAPVAETPDAEDAPAAEEAPKADEGSEEEKA